MVRLDDLVKKEGPLSAAQLKKVRKWLDEDWESHDVPREAVALIRRLLDTAEADPVKPKKPPRLTSKQIKEALERGARSADELQKQMDGTFRAPRPGLILR